MSTLGRQLIRVDGSVQRKKPLPPRPDVRPGSGGGSPVATPAPSSGRRSSTRSTNSQTANFYFDVNATTAPTERRASASREDELSQAIDRKQRDLLDLQAKFDKVIAENSVIHKEWSEATQQLNRLQAERNYKVDDDFLIAAWTELRFQIKNWANTHFDGDSRPNKQPCKDIVDLTPNYKAFLRSPLHRPQLVQAYVWDTLKRKVFLTSIATEGLIWAGHGFRHLRGLSILLDPSKSLQALKIVLILIRKKNSKAARESHLPQSSGNITNGEP